MLEQINDTDIRSQVETLLADESELQAFLAENNTTEPKSTHIDEDPISPGTLINRIRIIKLLGQGGMGSVYLGFDEKLERQVAVKSIRSVHLKNPSTQQRFVREAQILSKINHPSICQLYDYMETAEGDFLVLEYIKGKPLYQVPLNEEEKLKILAELATALAVAHEHGIVHRDLKPDNIMITEQGQLKVLDFGIAQSLTQPKVERHDQPTTADSVLTQHGSLVGTIRYMSPEQAQGKSINTASDLYALGIIAQEVFSHQAAYEVMETDQLLIDVQQGKRLQPDDLPETIQSVITDLTRLEPDQRPTATSAAQQFTNILLAPKRRKQRKTRWTISTAMVILVVVLLWQWQQFGTQADRNQRVSDYENQINNVVIQAEQIYVLPIHPVAKEIGLLLKQGESLYAEIEADPVLTEQDKQRLTGLIMLRAEYYEPAIQLLTEGEGKTQLLAEAWTKLYIEKASDFSDQHGYEQAMQDPVLQQDYLQPALKYINLVQQQSAEEDLLFKAFALSQTESLDAGLVVVNELLEEKHWNKDAVKLKALILSASMQNAQQKGQWETAKSLALMTAETYQRSTQMARSYPPGYESLCYTYFGLMADGVQRSGNQVDEFATRAIEACNQALVTLPQNRYPKFLLARIHMMKARWAIFHGRDPSEALAQAKDWNQQATSLEDLFNSTWNQALIAATEASHLMLTGQDAMPLLNQTVVWFEQLLNIDSAYRPYVVSDFLFVLGQQAHELIRQGQDPRPVLTRAQNLYDDIMVTPDLLINEQWGLVNNMAQVYLVELRHEFDQGRDIMNKGEQLVAFLNPADNQLINDPHQLINLANTLLLLAEHLRRSQLPFDVHVARAEQHIKQALTINNSNSGILLSQANLETLKNYLDGQEYQAVNSLFERVMHLSPNNPYYLQAWAQSLLVQAQNVAPDRIKTTLNQANKTIQQALNIDPQNPSFLMTQQSIKTELSAMDQE